MPIKDKISKFLDEIRQEVGFIPKFAHNKNPDGKNVYYAGPDFDDSELAAAIECLLIEPWSVNGEKVVEFENKFSEIIGQKYSTAVNSGSSANLIMVAAAKKYFKWTDDCSIIASCVNFPTTISPIIQNNLKVKFVDIEWETLNFDLNQIESKIDSKTKAIILSPPLGNPPDLDRLFEIAQKHNLIVLLDGCDSLLTSYKNKPIQSYFFASTCSFYPSHEITTISGGMVSSNNVQFMTLCRQLSSWARSCFCRGKNNLLKDGECKSRFRPWLKNQPDVIIDHKYFYENMGYNVQMLDIQAAIGIEQLKKIEKFKTLRKFYKDKVQSLFQKYVKNVSFPKTLENFDVSWFASPIFCESYEQKIKLVKFLEGNNIQTRNYFAGNLLLHKGFEHLDDYSKYPVGNEVLKKIFFIGNSPTWNQNHLDIIEEALKRYEN